MTAAGIDAAYVAHYTRAPERLGALDGAMRTIAASAYVVAAFDKEEMTGADIACINRQDQKRALTPGEVSLSAKHYVAYADVARRRARYALVLEDDAAFEPGFVDSMQSVMAMVDRVDADLVFVGGCIGLVASAPVLDAVGGLSLHKSNTSRCTHAYIVSLQGARKMLDLLPMEDPIDWHINTESLRLNMFWVEPPLVLQNGTMPRTGIRSARRL